MFATYLQHYFLLFYPTLQIVPYTYKYLLKVAGFRIAVSRIQFWLVNANPEIVSYADGHKNDLK